MASGGGTPAPAPAENDAVSQTAAQETAAANSQPRANQTTGQGLLQALASDCPDGSAPAIPLMLEDDTGMVITGTRRDNDLLVRLVEQYDVPNLQVLIEIFMITVSKNFSREIDSLLRANPSGGGNNVSEFTLSSFAQTLRTRDNSFQLSLSAPNESLTGRITFLESNKLARLVSSPTILVADGESATILRTQTARVLRIENTAKDNQTVSNELIDELKHRFR